MCSMGIETAYKASTVVLWGLIALNVWNLWRGMRSRKAYDAECARLRDVSAAFEKATQEYQEAYDKLMEIRERLMRDDRNEDDPGAGNE